MHIVIAPNAFKNSLTADAAAEAIETGLRQSRLNCTTCCLPVGDGGDGTGTLLTKLCGGSLVEIETVDALGRKIKAPYGLIDDASTAVIEMSAASGLRQLTTLELDPMKASSFGTGLQLLHALNSSPKKILLCVGGSATVEGGCGILLALGCKFYDEMGHMLTDMPGALTSVQRIDASDALKQLGSCALTVLCDVVNPLLGQHGAAPVFGPQKGASPEQVHQLAERLRSLAEAICNATSHNISTLQYGGAAGGTAAGLAGLLGARLENGIEYFLDRIGFDEAIEHADLVITGEGSVDRQTLGGKAPFGVAVRAKQKNILTVAFTGRKNDNDHEVLRPYFSEIIAISHATTTPEEQLGKARENLTAAAKDFGNRLAKKSRLPG